MGITYADIRLENGVTQRRVETRALVDSGSVFLTIPQHICKPVYAGGVSETA
jgi:hypothetical protein